MSRPAGIGLVRVVMLFGVVLLAVLLFAAPPQSRPRLTQAAPEEAKEVVEVTTSLVPGYGSIVTPPVSVPEINAALEGSDLDEDGPSRVHWTSKGVEVRIGPATGYVVIGQLPRASRLQIVGRDESSKWIGIVFSPYTGLTGWIEASAVAGQLDIAGLDVAPVTLLKLGR